MGKKILSVIVGYITMALFVFVSFTVAYLLMGTEGAFQPGSYDVSVLWIVASIILGLVAAVLGGLVCFAIGKSGKASMVLAGIVLVLGIALAIPTLTQDESEVPQVRGGEVGSMEAMQSAQQPTWLAFLNPLIGAVGVVIGSRLKEK